MAQKNLTLWIQSYKAGSGSVKRLRNALSDVMAPRVEDANLVVNWGKSNHFGVSTKMDMLINPPECTSVATNKVKFFEALKDDSIVGNYFPKFWTTKQDALAWMQAHPGKDVVCRLKIKAHDGDGIVITSNPDEVPECPLYTEYIKKKHEYRIHVFEDDIIRVQQKKRKSNFEGTVNSKIRNTKGGWIFATEGVTVPDYVMNACLVARSNLYLDFGAFDVIHNEYFDKWYILECNTAPGIEGSTVDAYAQEIRRVLDQLQ